MKIKSKEEISKEKYGEEYEELCDDRKRIVIQLWESQFL